MMGAKTTWRRTQLNRHYQIIHSHCAIYLQPSYDSSVLLLDPHFVSLFDGGITGAVYTVEFVDIGSRWM